MIGAQCIQRDARRIHLGFPLAGPGPRPQLRLSREHVHLEMAGVGGTAFGDHFVARRRLSRPLQPFLQFAFGIVVAAGGADGFVNAPR